MTHLIAWWSDPTMKNNNSFLSLQMTNSLFVIRSIPNKLDTRNYSFHSLGEGKNHRLGTIAIKLLQFYQRCLCLIITVLSSQFYKHLSNGLIKKTIKVPSVYVQDVWDTSWHYSTSCLASRTIFKFCNYLWSACKAMCPFRQAAQGTSKVWEWNEVD
jgi:hypothetical protein